MGFKRIVCICTAICFLLSCSIPASAFAASDDAQQSGDAAAPGAAAAGAPADEAGKAETVEKTTDQAIEWYIKEIPMKKEHQKLLWEYCRERKLDYIDMLALISLESNFNEKSSTKKYKGYFQISTAHGPNLSKTLKTPNKPLDGAININWGTAMFSWILADKRVKGLEGKKLRDAALSIYHRGTGGYDRYGLSKSYLEKYYKKRDIICSYIEKADIEKAK